MSTDIHSPYVHHPHVHMSTSVLHTFMWIEDNQIDLGLNTMQQVKKLSCMLSFVIDVLQHHILHQHMPAVPLWVLLLWELLPASLEACDAGLRA